MAPNQHRLHSQLSSAPSPGRIAFTSNRDGNPGVYVMLSDGTDVSRLTDNSSDANPAWSPDGTRIAFTSGRDGVAHIWIVNADGSGIRRVSGEAADEAQPTWSPDGKRIAFVSGRDDPTGISSQIYVMNADGSSPTRITNLPNVHALPEWSPDGARIVFWARAGQNLWVTNPDGSGVQQLSVNEPPGSSAAWTRDGHHLAISTVDSTGANIYIVDADTPGQGALPLTSIPANYSPTWSPDYTSIAFVSTRDGNREIYVMNADGSGQTRITDNTASDDEPSWQPTTSAGDTIASIYVDPPHTQASIGMSGTFTAALYDAAGTQLFGRQVVWSSSNSAAVTIDSTGFARAVGLGAATITATSGGKSSTATVNVGQYPSPVNDLAVASVADTSATLTFTQVDDGLGSPASYDVRFAVASIAWGSAASVARGSCATPVGGTAIGARLSCTVNGLTSGTSYNFELVPYRGTLNSNAVFGPISNVASAATGRTVASVTVTPGSASGTVGQSAQFTATVTGADGSVLSGQPVVWSVTDTTVVSITATGYATAVGPGSAAIVATAGGKSGRAPVTVTSTELDVLEHPRR